MVKTRPVLILLFAILFACSSGEQADDTDGIPDVEIATDPGIEPGHDDTPGAPCTGNADCQDLAGVSPCRRTHCLVGAGVCIVEDLDEGAACDPGNPCVVMPTCQWGKCRGAAVDCDDGDPCTADNCLASAGGCVHGPASDQLTCNDHSPCTTDDACVSGVCVGTPVLCADDGNSCTSVACDPETGECRLGLLLGVTCDDGDACTIDDGCEEGALCVGTPVVCDDGNPCTDDACLPASGTCAFTPHDGRSCHDGNPCTSDDTCQDGVCAGTGFNCDDGNACTTDACTGAGDACTHGQLSGVACDDGDACTGADRCLAGECLPGAPVPGCCSSDAECDDGDACTIEACQDHVCTSAPVTCVVTDPCSWTRCVQGTCESGTLPPGGHLELLHVGFETAENVASLTLVSGQVEPGLALAGQRALAIPGNGAVLRVKDLFVPSGTAVLQGYFRAATCVGTGLQVVIDGMHYAVGCGSATRWSPFQVPIVSNVGAFHTLEIQWWGGAPVWLDEVSVVLAGRLGCARGLSAERLGAPSDLLAADVVVDAAYRPTVAVARADDGSGAAVLLARPDQDGWSFSPLVQGIDLTGAANDVVFRATALAGGGLAAAWSSGQNGVRVAFSTSNGEAASVIGLVGSGPSRAWPDLIGLADGRLFVGFTSSKSTNSRFQPLAYVWDPAAIYTGAAWLPSPSDAVAPNRVAVVQLDTQQRVVVWVRDDQVRAAIADLDGTVVVPDFAIHAGAVSSPGLMSAAALADGHFVVVWEQAGFGTDLVGSMVDAYGTVIVDRFPVALDPTGEELAPDVAGTFDGRFVVSWEDQPTGGTTRVVARVFRAHAEGGPETVIDDEAPDGSQVRDPRVAFSPPYFAELAWVAGSDVHFLTWGVDCAEGAARCNANVNEICVGSGYTRLGGTCVGPACAPLPCD